MTGVFEAMATDERMTRESQRDRVRGDEKALFHVEKKLGGYLKSASSADDLDDRILLASEEIEKIAREAGATDEFVEKGLKTALRRKFATSQKKSASRRRGPKLRMSNIGTSASNLGWKLQSDINSYVASGRKPFICTCGTKIASEGRKQCKCGRQWNYWTIQSKQGLRSLCREVPLRENKIAAEVNEGDELTLMTEDGDVLQSEVVEVETDNVESEPVMANTASRKPMVRRDNQRVAGREQTRQSQTRRVSAVQRHAGRLRVALKDARNASERQFVAGFYLASNDLPLPKEYRTASSVQGYKAGRA